METAETAKRLAETWTDFVSLRWKRIDRPKSNLGKIALEEFVRSQSMPHLEVIKVFAQSADVDFHGLPDYFVFKPATLWSGIGVRLLHRIAGLNSYFDAKNDVVVTEREVREGAHALEKKFGKELEFIVEQRAVDEDLDKKVPLDYKVFTFYGVPKFVLQVDRNFNPAQMALFDGRFEPIIDGRAQVNPDRPKTHGKHRRPECWLGILELASQITLKLEAPFISVDCFATPDGPMLGELTHTPGGPWYQNMYSFSSEFDMELGAAWRDGITRLGLPEVSVSVPYQVKKEGRVLRTIH